MELGDDISPCQARDTRTLIIANHQSTADVPLLMACFSAKPDILPNIMWIMDRVFKFTNFGIVSVLHQDFFIRAVGVFLQIVLVINRIFASFPQHLFGVCQRRALNRSIQTIFRWPAMTYSRNEKSNLISLIAHSKKNPFLSITG